MKCMQAILLAGWNRSAPLKSDEWLAHSYTVAVSSLKSVLGSSMKVVMQWELSTDQQRKALTSVATGRSILSQALLHPTGATKLFHLGSNLMKDWDRFNLKIVEPADTLPEVYTNLRKKSQTTNSSNASNTSEDSRPKRKAKSEASMDDGAGVLRESVLRDSVTQAKQQLKSASEKSENSERTLKRRIDELEKEAATSANKVGKLKEEIKVISN